MNELAKRLRDDEQYVDACDEAAEVLDAITNLVKEWESEVAEFSDREKYDPYYSAVRQCIADLKANLQP